MTRAVFLVAALAPLFGQTQFEVVSVKPAESHVIGIFNHPGGRVEASSVPADYLIQEAFDIQPFQISGLPRWAREERFDLTGKPPESSPLSKSVPASFKSPLLPEQREMLQAALADRFQLHFHWETKEGPIYLLVKNGKELKLQDSKDKNEYPWAGFFKDGIQGINESMANLAERISPVMDVPVIDRTGLDGSYDFEFRSVGDNAEPNRGSVIMTSLQGLGLKLEASRGPIKVLVVDRLERPTAN